MSRADTIVAPSMESQVKFNIWQIDVYAESF